MKRFLLFFVVFGSIAMAQTGPGGVGKTDGTSSLKLWLDAADATSKSLNSTTVSQWSDKSGNTNHGTQGTANKQPTNNVTGINSRETITFDGVNDVFNLPNNSVLTNNAPCTFFCLVKPANLTGYRVIYCAGAGGGYTAFETNGNKLNYYDAADALHTADGITALSTGTSYIYDANLTAGTGTAILTMNLNGGNEITSSATTYGSAIGVGNPERTIGGSASNTSLWNGEIGEVIIYNVKLNSAERIIVGSYLGAKWNISFSGTKYGGGSTYGNNVIGIGKESDGVAGASQNGALVLTQGGTFNAGDYLLAGHNNGTGLTTSDVVSSVTKRWSRIWYFDKTSSSTYTLKIAFDFGDYAGGTPTTATNYRLLYRSGTSGNFSETTVTGTSIVNTDQVEFSANANDIADGYYTLGTTNEGASPLPVELVSFSASPKGNTVELQWNTATEVNNYGFEVERSENLKVKSGKWEKISFVEGVGTSNTPKEYSYTEKDIPAGKYSYRLKQIDRDGKFEYSKSVQVEIAVPHMLMLSQNYPNPFNPTTVISYQLPVSNHVSLKVYDVLGREVATLINGNQNAGSYTYQFSTSQYQLSSGLYFYRLQAGSFTSVRKMMLTK